MNGLYLMFQLLFGSPEQKLNEFKLIGEPKMYHYLNQGGDTKVGY